MQEGIYKVVFSTNHGGHGEGLAVLKQSAVNGGDASYLYSGEMKVEGGARTATLNVKRWNKLGPASVFGNIGDFTLQLAGKEEGSDTDFYLSGTTLAAPGATITIRCTKLSEAA